MKKIQEKIQKDYLDINEEVEYQSYYAEYEINNRSFVITNGANLEEMKKGKYVVIYEVKEKYYTSPQNFYYNGQPKYFNSLENALKYLEKIEKN